MGLSIARRSVPRQRGNVWTESEPGRGETFYFPLRAGENATQVA